MITCTLVMNIRKFKGERVFIHLQQVSQAHTKERQERQGKCRGDGPAPEAGSDSLRAGNRGSGGRDVSAGKTAADPEVGRGGRPEGATACGAGFSG